MSFLNLYTRHQREKLEIIYRTHRRMMYGVAYKILKNPADAEDALHQAFVSIAEKISKISDPDCPKTRSYIVTIIENKSIDVLRKRKRHPEIPYRDVFDGLAVDYEGSNAMAYCMARLQPDYRNVLLLKYYHGHTTQEIAELMNIKPSYAAKLEQRAKAKLEKLCKEENLL